MKKIFIASINEKGVLVKGRAFVDENSGRVMGVRTFFPTDPEYSQYPNEPVVTWEEYTKFFKKPGGRPLVFLEKEFLARFTSNMDEKN